MTTSIVSDSSPLISFARAKKLHLIQGVYEEIIIPPEVYEEIVVKGKGRDSLLYPWRGFIRAFSETMYDKKTLTKGDSAKTS